MRKIFSIRFKITALTIGVILALILSIAAVCFFPIREETYRRSVELMRVVGHDAQNELDEYFLSIEQSVGMAANQAIDTLDSVVLVECGAAGSQAGKTPRTREQNERLTAYLTEYCEGIRKTFESVANHTQGVTTYFYSIAPAVSTDVHGFFYSRTGKAGFVEQPPLDAGKLDPDDTGNTWYYTTVERGRPSWVGPYISPDLGDEWIYSYLVPIYDAGTLVGVLGMDIPLDTLAEQVRPIRVYQSGFAMLTEPDGRILCHPELPIGTEPTLAGLNVPRELMEAEDSGGARIRYTTAEGELRQMSFSTLRSGMKLVIIAPVREINSTWLRLINLVVEVAIVAIIIYAGALLLSIGFLTRPLLWLTAAAGRLANSDYDVELTYKSRDEVGELTDAFRQMRDKLKATIEDLRRRAFTDDLTGLPNMQHFLQLGMDARREMLAAGQKPALLYFNLIGLKHFNRQYGYPEGNELLRAVARILESHYGAARVCRVGQDHFAAVTGEEGLEEELRAVFKECQSANEGRSLPVRVGIYRDSTEDVRVNTACDRAKYACDLRRDAVSSGFAYFETEMVQEVRLARYVVNHLDQAIAEKWIQVYYQPLVRAVNLKVCDEEALARWIDPVRGFLSPADFIPALEQTGEIYKLDLYVLEQILEKMKRHAAAGIEVVPHSVNLSRSDFDACDMVEEIRTRVDAAGVERRMITIEITESIIGSDFDYIKEQVERFRALGFPVWMDDFGSGYSSLDVLQSIRFDLLKLDMSFMRRLDEGEDSKIILSKLMEMATAIGMDTVCEGVETAGQVQFLQEIGCSKLQGYYFSKPLPSAEIMDRHFTGKERFGYENPEESSYYESVGQVNLYDLDVIAADENTDDFLHAFSTLPMGVVELRDDAIRFLRSNQSCRDFVQRYFGQDIASLGAGCSKNASEFLKSVARVCCEQGQRAFYDEKMPDGSKVHAFARRIGVDPVNGSQAVALAVLSITEPGEDTTYADIAHALAADYYNLFVVDMDTDEFVEYASTVGGEELAVKQQGGDFFEAVKRDALRRVYPEDLDTFLTTFSKENVVRSLETQGVFSTSYRLTDSGKPVYSNMKITRLPGGNRIILGVSIVDAQMKDKERYEALVKERGMMQRIMALSDGYMSLYTVDPETGEYLEYSSSGDFDTVGASKSGGDFYRDAVRDAGRVFHPDDMPEFTRQFTRENILRQIREHGSFSIQYRLMLQGEYRPVILKIARFKEGEDEKLIAGVRALRKRR